MFDIFIYAIETETHVDFCRVLRTIFAQLCAAELRCSPLNIVQLLRAENVDTTTPPNEYPFARVCARVKLRTRTITSTCGTMIFGHFYFSLPHFRARCAARSSRVREHNFFCVGYAIAISDDVDVR